MENYELQTQNSLPLVANEGQRGGFTAGGKIGATGYFIPYEGSLIIGRELNIGFGLPAGLVPVNGAGGVSNTWILHDFYNYGK